MKLEINLSPSSVKKALRQVKEYQREMNNKNRLFVKRLAEVGIPVIESNIQRADGDSDKYHDTKITVHSFGDYSQATLTVSGKDILFIEFGAGIHYNNSQIPHASQFGYGIGTYNPGSDNAFNPEGWYYLDDSGVVQHSYGTEATMPVLKASNKIIADIRRIAREVYGSN